MKRLLIILSCLNFTSCEVKIRENDNDDFIKSKRQMDMNAEIMGTYILKSWRSIDSKDSVPPIQKGTLTFDGTRRIFTFVGRDDSGNNYAEMYVARYSLTDSSYSEDAEFLVLDHKNGSAPANYDFLEKRYTSKVTMNGKNFVFALPHPFENAIPVILEFQNKSIKANIAGKYEYFWEKE